MYQGLVRYWWVNQNQTFRQEIEGGYLWSPRRVRNRLGSGLPDLPCQGWRFTDCAVRRRNETPTASGYRTGQGPLCGIQGEKGSSPLGIQDQAAEEVNAMALTRDFKET